MACCTGRVVNQRREVCCHSNQHARAQQGGSDISRLDSDLQKQWDHAANGHLGSVYQTTQPQKGQLNM